MLLASGLIVGESIIGVVISAIVVFSGVAAPLALVGAGFETAGKIIGGIAFVATGFVLYRWVLGWDRSGRREALCSGERTRLACWLWRPRQTTCLRREKSLPARAASTREARALPGNSCRLDSSHGNIDPRNPPNEFPDIVGAHPMNPILASFRPFIPAHARLRELTPLPLIIGTLLGMVFGASSLYLVLKVGLTVSASIPVAVISITFFRLLSKFGLRDSTILENNIVQTAGSAGESIAFGLGVTMPAIMILGFDLEITRVMLVAILGGLIGVLMMIPLRRALIVQQHGYLKYPEGTACAEVLKAAASPESRDAAHGGDAVARAAADEAVSGGKIIIGGFAIGFIYYGLLRDLQSHEGNPGENFRKTIRRRVDFAREQSRVARCRLHHRSAHLRAHDGRRRLVLSRPDSGDQIFRLRRSSAARAGNRARIADMTVEQIQQGYILYIGAGAVAAAGIISLFRSCRLIWHGLKGGLADLRSAGVVREDAAAHGSGPLDEMGHRRDHRLARRHHDRAAIESAL